MRGRWRWVCNLSYGSSNANYVDRVWAHRELLQRIKDKEMKTTLTAVGYDCPLTRNQFRRAVMAKAFGAPRAMVTDYLKRAATHGDF